MSFNYDALTFLLGNKCLNSILDQYMLVWRVQRGRSILVQHVLCTYCSLQAAFSTLVLKNHQLIFSWNLKFPSTQKFFNVYLVKNLQIFTFLAPLIKSQGVYQIFGICIVVFTQGCDKLQGGIYFKIIFLNSLIQITVTLY